MEAARPEAPGMVMVMVTMRRRRMGVNGNSDE